MARPHNIAKICTLAARKIRIACRFNPLATMKAQHLLLALPIVEAYLSSTPRHSFVGRVSSSPQPVNTGLWRMDMEGDMIDAASRFNIETMLQQKTSLDRFVGSTAPTVEEAEVSHGMPWTNSIDPKAQDLLYMPFWEWQMDFMKDNLTNLKVESCRSDFSYIENGKKKARMVNLCFSSRTNTARFA